MGEILSSKLAEDQVAADEVAEEGLEDGDLDEDLTEGAADDGLGDSLVHERGAEAREGEDAGRTTHVDLVAAGNGHLEA